MSKNMGTIDRAIRILVALTVALLYINGTIGGPLAIVLGAFSVVFVATSIVGSCPLYRPLGVDTRGAHSK